MSGKRGPARARSLPARLPFYYGWVIVVLGGMSVMASGPGQTYGVAVFIDPMIDDLGWSRTLVSTLYTVGSLCSAAAIFAIGWSLDRWGARTVVVSATVGLSLTAVWMSRVASPVGLFAGFAGLRVFGQGALNMSGSTVVAVWFVRRRGLVVALAVGIGWMVSMAFLPPLSHWFIDLYGWRGAWVAIALLVSGVMLVPAALLLRRTPESVGLLPDGARPQALESAAPGAPEPQGAVAEVHWTLREALRTRAFWFISFAASAYSFIGTALMFHQVSLLGERGISSGVAASIFTVMAAASFVGNFGAGYLNDRLPNRYQLVLSQLAIAAVLLLLLFGMTATWHAFMYGVLLGLSSGISLNTGSVIYANYYGRRHLGSIRGVSGIGAMAMSAIGPMPLGAIFDAAGSYAPGLWLFLGFVPFTVAAALLSTPPRRSGTATPGAESVPMVA